MGAASAQVLRQPLAHLGRSRVRVAVEVREELAQNLCRCGTHGRIIRAVLRAAENTGKT